MDLRIYASAEVRKGGSMSRAPDLSAFPIPRKGTARPIVGDDPEATPRRGGEGEPAEASSPIAPRRPVPDPDDPTAHPVPAATAGTPSSAPQQPMQPLEPLAPRPLAAPSSAYGQTVATTVKLDENRYLRLMEAGKPSPGRLKRRTIQDMLIEALDEWFDRRRM